MKATTRQDMLRDAKLLIVDDDASNIKLLEDILRYAGYSNIRSTADPRGVVALFIEFQPDLMFLDLKMPYLDGFQVLDFIHPLIGETNFLPILVLTADDTFESRRRALSSGAMDFLTKPFIAAEVNLRVHNLLDARFVNLELHQQKERLEEMVIERTRELESSQLDLKQSQIEIIERLARAAEHHDDETGQHTQRVGIASALLAESLGFAQDRAELVARAAPLHDVGKIGIADAILLKRGRYTAAERELMKSHCVIGAEVLSGGRSEIVQLAERIAHNHHERWDGVGYPRALKEEAIPIEGRIVAVADVFDALTHPRPYKRPWTIQEALDELVRGSGRQFDPRVVAAFLELPHQKLI